MNKLIFLMLLTMSASAMAAGVPKKLECTTEGSRDVNFTLTKGPLTWRIDYLGENGKSEFHHKFVNVSLNPHRLLGLYLSSGKHEASGYIERLSINARHSIDGKTFSGSVKVKKILPVCSGRNCEQQRQQLQDEKFTCVAAQSFHF